jgi:hypothetical protein
MVYRKEGLNALFRAATATLREIWEKKGAGIPGIIAVVHTFGSDLKWNPHVHVIVTCGGLKEEEDGSWKWVGVDSVHFPFLRRCWRFHVSREVRRWGKKKWEKREYAVFSRAVNSWYVLDGKKEWYVNWGKKLKSLEYTVKYVGRYTKKPVIAETRLKSFDGEVVEFSHKDKVRKEEVTIQMEVREFIGRLVRHIPEKHQPMIRYAGLFANCVKKEMLARARSVMLDCLPVCVEKPVRSWRDRIWEWTGVDPYQCSCGGMMELVLLVVRVKGGGMVVIRAPPVSGVVICKTTTNTLPKTHSSVE